MSIHDAVNVITDMAASDCIRTFNIAHFQSTQNRLAG